MNFMLVIIYMLFTIIIISKLFYSKNNNFKTAHFRKNNLKTVNYIYYFIWIIRIVFFNVIKSIVISMSIFLMAYLFNNNVYDDIIIIYMYYKTILFYLIN